MNANAEHPAFESQKHLLMPFDVAKSEKSEKLRRKRKKGDREKNASSKNWIDNDAIQPLFNTTLCRTIAMAEK